MKNIFVPLSKITILAFALALTSCKSSFLPYNTTIALNSERLTTGNIETKRVLVVSYDSELTREFVISLKNYVKEELKTHNVIVERINIRQNEKSGDGAEFNKLKIEFKPDYLLTINVRDERVRKFYVIGGNVKKLRGMTIDFNLVPTTPEDTNVILWKSNASINHFYSDEGVSTARKVAKELCVKMQKDSIFSIVRP